MKIAYALPEKIVANDDLARIYPDWTAEKIFAKTGIASRHVAGDGETALDLGERAARGLFSLHGVTAEEIDFLLLCTQSAEYVLPSSACLLQNRLGIPSTVGALSFDHGCSGFIYGLSLAKGLIVGGMANRVLLVTAETYTKYIAPEDKSTRTIIGDGAAATVIDEEVAAKIGAFSFGTDGSGAEKLIVREGKLFMDGPEIFNFTLDVVPKTMDDVFARNNLTRGDIDLYVFHQANKFMLDTIRKVDGLPRDKFYVNLENTGNTVSSTIPIALKQLDEAGRLKAGMKVMLMGFGVGLSWGSTIITI
ncbi:MAG: ketoacyl-ACP synthase III [Bacteroidales bacterium]|nr:ketoacyl-ACP synthase III [Bacteroidales bacterium]